MSFFRREDGASWLEFALVLILIAIVVLAILTLFADQVNAGIEWITQTLSSFQ